MKASTISSTSQEKTSKLGITMFGSLELNFKLSETGKYVAQ